MYLLYLDESGQHGGSHFVLAGLAVHETSTYWLAKRLDDLQRDFFPECDEPLEFHAAVIRAAQQKPWNQLREGNRHHRFLDRAYEEIVASQVTLFAVALERTWLPEDRSEYGFALESLLKTFDTFLVGLYKSTGQQQRGLVVIAESQYRDRLEELARKVRREGTQWGRLYNLAEAPLFTPARNTRLLQAADLCANAVWGYYETGHALHYNRMIPKFAAEGGVISGLWHFTHRHLECPCPACLSRRLASWPQSGRVS